MSDYATSEALADWLDFKRNYEPIEGVDFDRDEPATKPLKPTTPDVWGALLSTEDLSAPMPF